MSYVEDVVDDYYVVLHPLAPGEPVEILRGHDPGIDDSRIYAFRPDLAAALASAYRLANWPPPGTVLLPEQAKL